MNVVCTFLIIKKVGNDSCPKMKMKCCKLKGVESNNIQSRSVPTASFSIQLVTSVSSLLNVKMPLKNLKIFGRHPVRELGVFHLTFKNSTSICPESD
ncbi:Threonine synthase-like [Trichinella spiralis]|uniref:Threonine synthase-like n=1 Tax=Trichinella spiralis TaxID=6334 RepID=A0ABR3KSP4_TRISP